MACTSSWNLGTLGRAAVQSIITAGGKSPLGKSSINSEISECSIAGFDYRRMSVIHHLIIRWVEEILHHVGWLNSINNGINHPSTGAGSLKTIHSISIYFNGIFKLIINIPQVKPYHNRRVQLQGISSLRMPWKSWSPTVHRPWSIARSWWWKARCAVLWIGETKFMESDLNDPWSPFFRGIPSRSSWDTHLCYILCIDDEIKTSACSGGQRSCYFCTKKWYPQSSHRGQSSNYRESLMIEGWPYCKVHIR